MLDGDKKIHLISFRILMTCLLDDVEILEIGRNFMLISSESWRVDNEKMIASRDKELAERKDLNCEKWKINKNKTKQHKRQKKNKTKQKKKVESIESMHHKRNQEFKIERRSDIKGDHRFGMQWVEQISWSSRPFMRKNNILNLFQCQSHDTIIHDSVVIELNYCFFTLNLAWTIT